MSNLFTAVSVEQQEIVAGGRRGPRTVIKDNTIKDNTVKDSGVVAVLGISNGDVTLNF